MAKIFYSMAGEGRGHAVRAHTLVGKLQDRHEFVLFAPGDAYDFLAAVYAGHSGVQVRRIAGLRFHYVDRRLSLPRTLKNGLHFRYRVLPPLVQQLSDDIRAQRPHLVISDFEPALCRAAARCGVPQISLNHQHFLVACDLSTLPRSLRRYARLMSLIVPAFCVGQRETIVSSFFAPPLKPSVSQVTLVGPLIRQEVAVAQRTSGDYLVAYLRPCTPESVLDALQASETPARVYGLGERPPEGPVTFHNVDAGHFAVDLAGCRAAVAGAGNQLIGESMYLGKPFFGLPERNHHEQMINAHFLEEMGCGTWDFPEELTARKLSSFLERLDGFRTRINARADAWDGTARAIDIIRRYLPDADGDSIDRGAAMLAVDCSRP